MGSSGRGRCASLLEQLINCLIGRQYQPGILYCLMGARQTERGEGDTGPGVRSMDWYWAQGQRQKSARQGACRVWYPIRRASWLDVPVVGIVVVEFLKAVPQRFLRRLSVKFLVSCNRSLDVGHRKRNGRLTGYMHETRYTLPDFLFFLIRV